jgi:hypothetical protein
MAVVNTGKNAGFILLSAAALFLCTSFGTPWETLFVSVRNTRDETIFVHATAFDHFKTKNPNKASGAYTFEYFGMDAGGIHIGGDTPDPVDIQSKTDYLFFMYLSEPKFAGWHDKPVEEQFRLVYREFMVYDAQGVILLRLEDITADNFVSKITSRGTGYNWYLVIK